MTTRIISLSILCASHSVAGWAQTLSYEEQVVLKLDSATFAFKTSSRGTPTYTEANEIRHLSMELSDQIKFADDVPVEYLVSVGQYVNVIATVGSEQPSDVQEEVARALATDLQVKVEAAGTAFALHAERWEVPVSFQVRKDGEVLQGTRVTCQPDLFATLGDDILLSSVFAGALVMLPPGSYTYKVFKGEDLLFMCSNNRVRPGMKQPVVIDF